MRKSIKLSFFFIFLTTALSSCSLSSDNNPNLNKTPAEITQSDMMISDILKGDKIIALGNQDTLYLVDPDYARPVELYRFLPGEAPVNQNYDIFKVSPQKQSVLWYTPQKGLISLSIKSQTTTLLEASTDFFNTYPYFEFSGPSDIVSFIINNGNSLKQINLDTNETILVNIPYPYGNVFKIAPDQQAILFVSGYGQNQGSPRFMYTNFSNQSSRQFKADINVFDRNHIFWAPDSSGTIVFNRGNINFYSLTDPDQAQTLITLPENAQIKTIHNLGQHIFVYDDQGYWHIFDFYSLKEIARTPDIIAQELHLPQFIPWSKSTFLIEEKIKDGDLEFNRLWVSDFRGNKKIVFERYNENTIQDIQPTI